jgi:hypothetical protein
MSLLNIFKNLTGPDDNLNPQPVENINSLLSDDSAFPNLQTSILDSDNDNNLSGSLLNSQTENFGSNESIFQSQESLRGLENKEGGNSSNNN